MALNGEGVTNRDEDWPVYKIEKTWYNSDPKLWTDHVLFTVIKLNPNFDRITGYN